MEAKLRTRDVLAEPEKRFAFFDEPIPKGIYSGPTFEKWRKHDELGNDRRLFFTRRDQLLYLDWLRGRPAGDRLLGAPVTVVLAERGSPAQRRLAASARFRELSRDARAVLYTRRS